MKLWEQYIVGAEVSHWFHTTLVIEVWLWKMKRSTNNTASAPFRRCIQIAVWCATASHQQLFMFKNTSESAWAGDDLAMYSGCESDNRFSHWINWLLYKIILLYCGSWIFLSCMYWLYHFNVRKKVKCVYYKIWVRVKMSTKELLAYVCYVE